MKKRLQNSGPLKINIQQLSTWQCILLKILESKYYNKSGICKHMKDFVKFTWVS